MFKKKINFRVHPKSANTHVHVQVMYMYVDMHTQESTDTVGISARNKVLPELTSSRSSRPTTKTSNQKRKKSPVSTPNIKLDLTGLSDDVLR